ncbi:MAG: phosphoglycerate dehydrogenase [Myxococcales bacterium]|nr:phosphoglycerate dehydrogenase [Myxococcales bacterium]MCB9523696.1 phosphoglycerate dehydrogenase [Myxococcales bacterium]
MLPPKFEPEVPVSTSYPLHKIKVVLLENIHPVAVANLEAAGFTVELHDRAYQGAELLAVAGDAHLIGIRSKTRLTEEFFQGATRLWGVGAFCIGTNQIDLQAAACHGVPVFNEAFSNTRSVAELVIAETVALHRSLCDRSAGMHLGQWRKTATGAHEIRGKTMGIVGYGRIGSQTSVLAEAMGMKVIYHDVVDVLPMGTATKADSLEALLAEADVVTLHVPATEQTKNMIRAEQLALMKRGAYLLNNARGDVVDVEALAAALKDGHLGGAAVDVFPREPGKNISDEFDSPLRGLPNVILTPHIGGSTVEAQINIGQSVSARLAKLMNNGSTATAVNVPHVTLPKLEEDAHRVIHFHHNRPGVLGKINSLIAEMGANISSQYLRTDAKHGYLIIDISPEHGEALKDRLLAVPETIRVRTLW